MQRRVEEAHRDGQAVHGVEDLEEVGLLGRPQLLERGRLLLRGVGEDHRPHDRQAVLAEEHVLGAAQADALGAEVAGDLGVLAGVGVGPHGELALPDAVGPAEDDVELGGGSASASAMAPSTTSPVVPSREMVSPSATVTDADGELVAGDLHRVGAHDGGDAPAAGDDGGVAHQAAAGGEDALGHLHAVDVLRRGLVADEDHLLAALGRVDGVVGGEVHAPTAAPGEPPGPWRSPSCRRPRTAGGAPGRGGRHRRASAPRLGDLPALLLGHVDGHAQRGGAGALADAGLEHPELALLDGELRVAHVAVVLLEPGEDRQQLARGSSGTALAARRGPRCCGCRPPRPRPGR